MMIDQKAKVVVEDLDSEPSESIATPVVEPSISTPPNPKEEKDTEVVEPKIVKSTDDEKEKASASGSGKKVLLVEDEKPLAKALEAKLTSSGFKTLAVFNGQEALEELEKNKYELILLDLLMPVMDGWDLLAGLQEKDSKVTRIILSNLGQSEDLAKAKEMGAKDFWIKSDLSLAEIVARVSEVLA